MGYVTGALLLGGSIGQGESINENPLETVDLPDQLLPWYEDIEHYDPTGDGKMLRDVINTLVSRCGAVIEQELRTEPEVLLETAEAALLIMENIKRTYDGFMATDWALLRDYAKRELQFKFHELSCMMQTLVLLGQRYNDNSTELAEKLRHYAAEKDQRTYGDVLLGDDFFAITAAWADPMGAYFMEPKFCSPSVELLRISESPHVSPFDSNYPRSGMAAALTVGGHGEYVSLLNQGSMAQWAEHSRLEEAPEIQIVRAILAEYGLADLVDMIGTTDRTDIYGVMDEGSGDGRIGIQVGQRLLANDAEGKPSEPATREHVVLHEVGHVLEAKINQLPFHTAQWLRALWLHVMEGMRAGASLSSYYLPGAMQDEAGLSSSLSEQIYSQLNLAHLSRRSYSEALATNKSGLGLGQPVTTGYSFEYQRLETVFAALGLDAMVWPEILDGRAASLHEYLQRLALHPQVGGVLRAVAGDMITHLSMLSQATRVGSGVDFSGEYHEEDLRSMLYGEVAVFLDFHLRGVPQEEIMNWLKAMNADTPAALHALKVYKNKLRKNARGSDVELWGDVFAFGLRRGKSAHLAVDPTLAVDWRPFEQFLPHLFRELRGAS